MNEFNINLVGKEENIKKEEIFNNFDFNYLPMNNLPISYFPFNNPELSNELKNKDIDSVAGLITDDFVNENGIVTLDPNNKTLILTSNNYIKITKDIYVDLLLVGGGGGGSSNFNTSSPNISLTSNYISILANTTIIFNKDTICDILIVGGGGGGGWYGGGGGGGMVLKKKSYNLKKGIYNIIIGDGGIGGTRQTTYGIKGSNTSITDNSSTIFNAYGGGGGGGTGEKGNNINEYPNILNIDNYYYSGGIGGNSPLVYKSKRSRNSVNNNDNTIGGNGGSGYYNVFRRTEKTSCGGGGGAGNTDNIGNNGLDGNINNAGNGGDGMLDNITGNNIYYGGGGGGGAFNVIKSSGGQGGGGNGNGINGLINTGGGGGGGGYYQNGGKGGSGIVIIKFNIYSGGGGGETKFIKDYKLKKGIYYIDIGLGGTTGNDGKNTFIMKNNTLLLETKGGNKAIENKGGASHKNQLGKGGDSIINYDNSKLGELINIEGIDKYYGNGGFNILNTIRPSNSSPYGNGGNGGNGSNGVFILKYKNNDIDFIKKYLILGRNNPNININPDNSIGISVEPTADNPNYKLLVYRGSGTLILNKNITCDILIVGGGGGGGVRHAGGGGGGAVIYLKNQILNNGTYTITIGNGGNAPSSAGIGSIGSDSFIVFNRANIYLAKGGGYGAYNANGGDGGSGGGSSANYIAGVAVNSNKPTGIYGNNGGTGTSGTPESYWGGGGGGGAYLAGYNAVLNGALSIAGNGGDGIQISITGTPIYYGGGGGGGVALSGQSAGLGGKGGGGDGSKGAVTATSGTPNTGGGGGGSGFDGSTNGESGAGGSGIVIIRVKKEDIESGLSKDNLYKNIDKDTRIINDINDEFKKKLKGFENNDMPYNKFSIFPLVILIILIWLFIFLFLLKFVHHYFVNIYLYILLSIIIFLLLFGSMWFLYSNNDL